MTIMERDDNTSKGVKRVGMVDTWRHVALLGVRKSPLSTDLEIMQFLSNDVIVEGFVITGGLRMKKENLEFFLFHRVNGSIVVELKM